MYDPSHPDADWSGYVSLRSTRKHFSNQSESLDANLISIAHNKASENVINDQLQQKGNKSIRSSTIGLIGGLSYKEFSNAWETEAQSAAKRQKTALHQLTDKGRSICVRGKRPKTQIHCESYLTERQNDFSSQQTEHAIDKRPDDFIGFRAEIRSCASDPNIVLAIREKLNRKGIQPTPEYISSAPFATESNNVPTDPYLTSSGNRCKDLLLENFSSAVPGYTGKCNLYHK